MRASLSILLAAALLSAKENTISLPDAREGWLLLFEGESLIGWTEEAPAKWRVADGALLFDAPQSGLLRTTTPFVDYVLKFDFRAADADRAGDVFLRISAEGKPADTGYALRHGNGIVSVTKPEVPTPSSGAWHTSEIEVSGDKFTIRMDGRKVAEGNDARSKAGYIALEGKGGSRVEYRNIKLRPINTKKLFNGTELAGWKIANPAPPKPGGANPLKKFIPKIGGASKPKEAKWSVMNALIHGENGPGQLETQALYDDFILQLDLRITSKKKQALTAVYLRGEPGKIFSGYQVVEGGLAGLRSARKPGGSDGGFLSETIAARDRHFEIWVNGYPVTEYTDPRADDPSPFKGARTLAGSIGLKAPEGEAESDFRNINLASLPKPLGGDMSPKPAAPAPSPISATQPSANTPVPVSPAPAAPDPRQQQQQAKEAAKQTKISELTGDALKTSDPQRQMQVNAEILKLDPANMVASQNYKEAKNKIEAAESERQKQSETKAKQTDEVIAKETEASAALSKGEQAIVAGDLAAASRYLSVAKQLAPGNPRIQQLQNSITGTLNFRQRLRYVATGAGAIAVLGAIGLWWRSRGQKRPYLEVVNGLDKGKRFNLDQDVSHVGAIAEDGGAKNEIVVRDVERMVSRFHCEIHNQKGKLYLIDCNSANGTSLDGKQLAAGKPIPLKSGSTVQLGKTCALRLGFEKQKNG